MKAVPNLNWAHYQLPPDDNSDEEDETPESQPETQE
jgi:hypothetical protein